MTSDDLRDIFKNACTAEPLAEGWTELEKFGKAVIDACIAACEDEIFCAELQKAAAQEDGSPYYDHEKINIGIGAIESCIEAMRFNAKVTGSPALSAGPSGLTGYAGNNNGE